MDKDNLYVFGWACINMKFSVGVWFGIGLG